MMTYQAVRDGYPLRAAAMYGAFTDLGTFLDSSPQAKALAPKIWPDYESKKEEIHRRRSAMAWAEKLGVPILIMHGGNDTSVSPAQALALASKLQSLGKRYELIIRAGSNHVLTDWRIERDQHAMDWFRRHSSGAPVAEPIR
jgi:dipeptidyl aminopeptidase/acylaminoacyl peptidase